MVFCLFFFQAEDGIRDIGVTGVQTCALPIFGHRVVGEDVVVGDEDHLGAVPDFGVLAEVLLEDAEGAGAADVVGHEHRSEEHTSELQSRQYLVCRLLLEKKKKTKDEQMTLRT